MQNPSADDLRQSVYDFRDPATTAEEREQIEDYWAHFGIPNQFVAMFRAAEIERGTK